MNEPIDELRSALRPFAAAYARLRHYSEFEPSDDAPLMAEHAGVSFELLDGEEGPSVTVGDLRRAHELLNQI